MIRDTFFSASRFVSLCRKEMVESWRANLLRVVMMYGILAIAFVWNGYFQYLYPESLLRRKELVDPIWAFELIGFGWAVVIMGLLSASFIMERMKTKTNRISALMIPATMFEKFFSRWLIFTFGFLIAFLIAFKLADWTRVLVYTVSYPELKEIIASVPLSQIVGPGNWTIFSDNETFLLGISIYLFAQSLFVLGSSIWPKNAFVKTLSAIIVIAIVYVSVGALLVKILMEAQGRSGGVNASISDETMVLISTIAFFALALFNWIVAYSRFKESEIINRW